MAALLLIINSNIILHYQKSERSNPVGIWYHDYYRIPEVLLSIVTDLKTG